MQHFNADPRANSTNSQLKQLKIAVKKSKTKSRSNSENEFKNA